MFDFDEIETDVQRKGADAWKEGAGGGKKEEAAPAKPEGDFAALCEAEEPLEAKVPEKPKQEEVTIRVGFGYKGQRWSQEYKVKCGTTVLELKKLMTPGCEEEAGWFQLMKAGLPADDSEPLEQDVRVEFAYLPPRTPKTAKKFDMGPAPLGGWEGELQVTVCLDRISNWTTSFTVKKGSSIGELKALMAKQDPTGSTRTEDFELAANTATGRCPLEASTLIVDNRLSQLHLVAAGVA
mmetsp:Transcript_34230/g.79635  ORF Transcript_34230/g.79635 Transcript_34230/m.79635 type:complete len:238 (+) Transcript_34230:62-775(+)